MRIVVRRKDTGEYLYPLSRGSASFGPDLQKARIFGRKNDATTAFRNAFLYSYRNRNPEPRPGMEQLEVALSFAGTLPPEVQERLDLLDALEAEGVDNWDGYGYAIRRAAGEEED